ncbi:MAG: peptidase M14 family protein, partial [Firmicutes bacterium]|nr:peptidase M14 family protein [Bacillota bacterium]
MAKRITKPADFFGHELGAERKIAKWDKIVDYFYTLEKETDTIKVIDMGPSTEGQPFLAVYLSSKDNLDKLEHYRSINQKITDPRRVPESEVDQLIKEGKAVILQSMSLHASEIGGTQMAPQLAYELVSSNKEDDLRILDNVIFIMVPCFNPDGQLMVANWYDEWLGTEYEGCSLPWLYHKYAGHDNNRDAFALNLVESQYMAKIVFRDWNPHAYQDHHHMGSYGARLYIAPYSEPIRPDADPLVWRELSWYGAHMAYKLEEYGIQGVLNGAQFPGWGHFGFHWITNHHNIAGMLTESASANLATPKYIDSTQLTGSNDKSFPAYQEQSNFPNPWPGGWWTLADIVEQQKVTSWALLDAAAKNRETVLKNAYNKAVRQTQRGLEDKEYAYIIPKDQHDELTALKFIDLLLDQGIEVQQAKADFQVGYQVFPKDSFVVHLAQPKRGVIKHLVGQVNFEDNFHTERLDGSLMAYDSLADTVGEYMGVNIIPANTAFSGAFEIVDQVEPMQAPLGESSLYLISCRYNDSFTAVNEMLGKGKKVQRIKSSLLCADKQYPAGSFVVWARKAELEDICQKTGVPVVPLKEDDLKGFELTEAKKLKIGLFQRYWGGNADEGWTRLLLEKFGFEYKTIMDKDILAGNLCDRIDVLIVPSDRYDFIVDPTDPKDERTK